MKATKHFKTILISVLILCMLTAAGCDYIDELIERSVDAEVYGDEASYTAVSLTQETGEEVSADEIAEDEIAQEETAEAEEAAEPLEKYSELLEINPYIAGWLKIDDSVIDDPVVYTPVDQNYFLHRAIDGSDESKGTLFIAINWREGYNNTIIYGHNMKDGTAFGSLAKFADASYGRKHNILHFDTLYEERDFELYAAFYSQIDDEDLETDEHRDETEKAIEEAGIAKKAEEGEEVTADELTLNDIELYEDLGDDDIYRQEKDEDNGRFRYYYFTDLSDKADFEYFAKNAKERALYDTGVEAEWGDEFVTLSTCSYHVRNGRFVVIGIRKNQ